jgi:hypothetical protein
MRHDEGRRVSPADAIGRPPSFRAHASMKRMSVVATSQATNPPHVARIPLQIRFSSEMHVRFGSGRLNFS